MKEFKLIIATFKANKKDIKFWLQILASLAVVVLVVLHYTIGLNINSDQVLQALVGIGSILSLWGVMTDNSILKNSGAEIDPSTIIKNADNLTDQLDALTKSAKTAVQSVNVVNPNVKTVSTGQTVKGDVNGTTLPTTQAKQDSNATDASNNQSGTITGSDTKTSETGK